MSGEESSDMWLANLEEWVADENRVITAKGLSRELRVHVNVAKERLFLFVQRVKAGKVDSVSKDELKVIYLLAGRVDGRRKVVLVSEDKLESKEAAFDELTSKYVDSIARKTALKDDLARFNAQTEVVLRDPYLTTFGAVVNKAAVPRSGAREIVERIAVNNKPKIEMKPKTSNEAKKSEPAKSEVKVKQEDTKPEVSKSVSNKKGGKGNIAGMFANMASKKPASKPKAEVKVEVKKEETSPGKENRENEAKEKKLAEDEQAKGKKRSNTKLTKLESKPKRKRIQMMVDSDDSSDEEQEEEEVRVDSPPPPQAPLIESDEDEDLIPPTPDQKPAKVEKKSSKPGRKRTKKVVNKTFMDDKGFMVTKKEMESCSETDDEVEEEPKVEVKKPEPVIKAPKEGGKTKKTAASPKKQASIMNFFKKK